MQEVITREDRVHPISPHARRAGVKNGVWNIFFSLSPPPYVYVCTKIPIVVVPLDICTYGLDSASS